jgi:hypothetical protein
MSVDLATVKSVPDRVHDAARIIITRQDGTTVSYSTCDLEIDETLWEDPGPFAVDAAKVEFKRIVCEHYD